MRAALLATGALLIALRPGIAEAQGAGTTPVVRRAADVWNANGTTRVNGAYELVAGRSANGNVAVLNGPVRVAGTVHGALVAINADVRLAAGARIDGDLIIIGGTAVGTDSASLGSAVLQQAELLRYHLDGDRMELDREPEYEIGRAHV